VAVTADAEDDPGVVGEDELQELAEDGNPLAGPLEKPDVPNNNAFGDLIGRDHGKAEAEG
jgi:hypothetical protein